MFKCIKPEYRGSERHEALLRKEYEIGHSLSHHGVCEVISFVNIPELGNAIEMEWIDGESLADLLAKGRPDAMTSRKLIAQICDALEYVHGKQVIHRDIKPSNIMVTRNGSHIKLIDFGLADSDSYLILKAPAGTQSFAAPELINGEETDFRTDIYSLGKVIDLLSDKFPQVVKKCTQTDRNRRYDDVSQVKAAIMKRSRKWFWAVIALVAVVALSLVLLFTQKPAETQTSQEPQDSEVEAVISDPGAIDAIFQQATEMLEGTSGNQ